MESENTARMKFIKRVTHPEIAISSKVEIDLNDLRATYGDNFNTLLITNTDTTADIDIYLDGEKTQFVSTNKGTFNFDAEAKINYNFLSIENLSGAVAIATNKIKIVVGRTGEVL